MKLIIAEKPDAAMKISAPFGGRMNKAKGYVEIPKCKGFPNGAICGFAIGHLVGLASPEKYDENLKDWSLDTLPIIPEHFKYEVSEQKRKPFKVLKDLMQDSRITEIIIATDAGREGEAIFYYIHNLIRPNKTLKRLWISSLTSAGVKKGFENLKDAKETYSYFLEAQSRGAADWLVGMSMSRAMTILLHNADSSLRNSGVYSVGRVQTVLVALVDQREKEITNFKSEPFWTLIATFGTLNKDSYKGKWKGKDADRFKTKYEASKIFNACHDMPGQITEVKKDQKISKAPQLFSLSALQTKANKAFRMSPSKVLEIAQSLYTKGFLTYPRSDSQHLTKDEANTLPSILKKLECQYSDILPAPKSSITDDKRYTDASKVSDHHAIIMTEQIPNNLSSDDKKIYDLVVKSVIAAFYDDAIFNLTSITTEVNGHFFETKGKEQVNEGWRKVLYPAGTKDDEENEDNDNQLIPSINKGEAVKVDDLEVKEGKTSPPKRFTAGDLINLMKTAGKHIENNDDEDNDLTLVQLQKLGSIGTEATRAGIIETVIKRDFIKVEKNKVYGTPKGALLIKALGPDSILVKPETTAKWEHRLSQIGEGKASAKEFTELSKKLTAQLVKEAIEYSKHWDFKDEVNEISTQDDIGGCPKCGSPVRELKSKKGSFFGCSGYQNGCDFSISKKILGKSISITQATKLLEKGKSDTIKGFKSKAGKVFDTYLFFNEEKQKLDLGFNDPNNKQAKEEVGICPNCARPLIEHAKMIGCSGYKEGCEFKLWKTCYGKKLNKKELLQLIEKGQTTSYLKLKSKAGKDYEARLKMDDVATGKLELEFMKKGSKEVTINI